MAKNVFLLRIAAHVVGDVDGPECPMDFYVWGTDRDDAIENLKWCVSTSLRKLEPHDPKKRILIDGKWVEQGPPTQLSITQADGSATRSSSSLRSRRKAPRS